MRIGLAVNDNAHMQSYPDHHRRVRSFVKRHGRLTPAQRHALAKLFPTWGIGFTNEPLDLELVFGRAAPRVLDIGFGNGEALLATAASMPDVDYVGVEVHEPGVGHLLVLLEQTGLGNVRVIMHDVVEVVDSMLVGTLFDTVNIFFPDPWPKTRHHKRRLIQPDFLDSLKRIMRPEALLHIATDWSNYAEHIRALIGRDSEFVELEEAAALQNRLAYRPPTKFERRGRALGHSIVDLYYRHAPATK
jgi:tRNA (guanine-N7-)-methyltransferase